LRILGQDGGAPVVPGGLVPAFRSRYVAPDAVATQEGPDVKLINTDGMAFIGPGSEWFWTALSGLVLAVTFLAIYRQLRLQRGASAIEQLNRIEQEYASERLNRNQLALCLALRDGVDPTDLPFEATGVLNFWERVGSLARRKHIDMELLWDGGSGAFCQSDWVRLAPWIKTSRETDGNPGLAENFEWLVRVMEARAGRAGIPLDDAAQQAARLDRSIASLQRLLRIEESLRTVIVASPEALSPVRPQAAAAPAVAEG
jgi:hypothetical protein